MKSPIKNIKVSAFGIFHFSIHKNVAEKVELYFGFYKNVKTDLKVQ